MIAPRSATGWRCEPAGFWSVLLPLPVIAPEIIPQALVLLVLTIILWRLYLQREENRRKLARQRFESLFEHNIDAVGSVDREGRIERVNHAFLCLSGYTEQEVRGLAFAELIPESDRHRTVVALHGAVEGRPQTFETVLQHKHGHPVEIELATVPIVVDDSVLGAYQIARDITDRKKLERELEDRALHDYLTGLANRALFADRLEHAMKRVRRRARPVGLLYVDLDRFKMVNDTAGHAAGDALLREVADRFRHVLREGDTVARLGGDEFAVLLEDIEDESEAITAAERITDMMGTPLTWEGRELHVGVSVGIALSSPETSNPDELVRNADLAMYEAKRCGGHRHQLYTPDLEIPREKTLLHVERDLGNAIEAGELILHYQPIVDLSATRIVGAEALVRWQHTERGLIPPSSFVPLAEELGMIASLDRWVIQQGCRDVRHLKEDALLEDRPFFLSVNLSDRDFDGDDLPDEISRILEAEGMEPETLQVEITESVAGSERETIGALKRLGIKIAIDDFGTGYSSLTYLKDLDIDVLKIDRSFASGLSIDPTALAVVRTILTMADMLGVEVVVEGIEKADQLECLKQLGARKVQGFYFGRPVDFDRLRRMMRDGLPSNWEDEQTGARVGSAAAESPYSG